MKNTLKAMTSPSTFWVYEVDILVYPQVEGVLGVKRKRVGGNTALNEPAFVLHHKELNVRQLESILQVAELESRSVYV